MLKFQLVHQTQTIHLSRRFCQHLQIRLVETQRPVKFHFHRYLRVLIQRQAKTR